MAVILATLLFSTGSGATTRPSSEAQEIAQIRSSVATSHEDILQKNFKASCTHLSKGTQKFYEKIYHRSTCPTALAYAWAVDVATPTLRKMSVAVIQAEISSDRNAPVSFTGSGIILTERVHNQYVNGTTVYTMQAIAKPPYWLIYGFNSNISSIKEAVLLS